MRIGRTVRLGAIVTGTALMVTGCVSDSGNGGDARGGTGDHTVEIIGGPGGASGDALTKEVALISEATGIEVTYTPITDFDTVIQSRVAGNNPPDIALFPQPGILKGLAERGDVVALDDIVDVEAIGAAMVPGVADTGKADDGKTYGIPVSINVKSLVWIPIPEFADAGYTVPTSHQELLALTEQMKADGNTPWCMGIESGAATGWAATDWIEDYVLRIGGPEVYDQWVNHEIPFNSPVVKQAAEAFADLVLADDSTSGGRAGIVATNFGDAVAPLTTEPPGCYMHRQANFITGFMPDEVQSDLPAHVDMFLLPPYEGGYEGQAVLGGGDLAGVFDAENEDVKTVLEAMFSPDFGAEWAKSGEFLSPFPAFDDANYTNATIGTISQFVADADAFRFDGSDQMPGQVGSGSFWTEMTAWISGQEDLDSALANIEASWPTD